MSSNPREGCLLGTAVGDALGLPREGLKPRRAARMFNGPLRHRLIFGRGMVSDDTDHCRMVVAALEEAQGDVESFRRAFAGRLRLWFLGLPAGVGLATVKACLKLLIGIPPTRSGVPSAGNGAAMRAAPIGVFYRHDEAKLRAFVEASSRVTHTDERALQGALAVALMAAASARGESAVDLDAVLTHPSWREALSTEKGVSGYVVATVQAVEACWRKHPTDYRAAVTEAIEMGGDTDTVAAILGGIVGARVGKEGIPEEWRNGVWDFPFRNPVFLLIVLGHGFRRLLPPY
jgi:ADP-ribosylglycohydrolase